MAKSTVSDLSRLFGKWIPDMANDNVELLRLGHRVQASYREPTVNRGNEYGRSRWTGAKFQKENIKRRIQ
jgi:hypothetical protein